VYTHLSTHIHISLPPIDPLSHILFLYRLQALLVVQIYIQPEKNKHKE
jgi:hypothetical protein